MGRVVKSTVPVTAEVDEFRMRSSKATGSPGKYLGLDMLVEARKYPKVKVVARSREPQFVPLQVAADVAERIELRTVGRCAGAGGKVFVMDWVENRQTPN